MGKGARAFFCRDPLFFDRFPPSLVSFGVDGIFRGLCQFLEALGAIFKPPGMTRSSSELPGNNLVATRVHS